MSTTMTAPTAESTTRARKPQKPVTVHPPQHLNLAYSFKRLGGILLGLLVLDRIVAWGGGWRAWATTCLVAAPQRSLLACRISVFNCFSDASSSSWFSCRFRYSLISAVFSCCTCA